MPGFPIPGFIPAMADFLFLRGAAAFSAFRLQRLEAKLAASLPELASVTAEHWHVAALKAPLTEKERVQLAQLLEEQPVTAAEG